MKSPKAKLLMIGLGLVILTLVSIASSMIGTVNFTVGEILNLFTGNSDEQLIGQIVYNVRIPRILTGLLVGLNLSISGVLLQGILRNPMASPNIIGVSAGAGLSAIFLMTLMPGAIEYIPVASFLGALLACTIIYLIAMRSSGGRSIGYIVLAGVAVSSLLNSISSALMTINSDSIDVTYAWLLGSLSGRSWNSVTTILPYSIVGLFVSIFISPKVNLFTLGDEVATSIGLQLRTYRIIIIATAAMLAGSAVSVAGTVGFIGLIAPHSAKLIIGEDHRYLIPMSAIVGAILLVISDTIARTIFSPMELSVGIVTSILGAPFFLFILFRKGKSEVME